MQTNDKQKSCLKLTISGKIEKFVTIRPSRVILQGSVEDDIKSSVTIVPEEKYNFKITEAKIIDNKNSNNIAFKLKELEKQKTSKTTKYLLTVKNMKKERGRYRDIISLKTTSEIRPEIKVRVYGNIIDKRQTKKANE